MLSSGRSIYIVPIAHLGCRDGPPLLGDFTVLVLAPTLRLMCKYGDCQPTYNRCNVSSRPSVVREDHSRFYAAEKEVFVGYRPRWGSLSSRSQPRWSAGRATPGQAMTEFALVVPIFLSLVFGLLELGMLLKGQAAYQEAAQQAVRVAAASGNNYDADAQALAQLKITLVGQDLSKITLVQIYKANGTGGFAVPISTTAPYDNAHTDYVYNAGSRTFVCKVPNVGNPPQGQGPPCNNESYWNPTTRNTTVGTGTLLDHIGIVINYDYKGVTGVLPLLHLSQSATTVIEPNSYSS